MDINVILTTINLAALTTLILFIVGIPLAFWLNESQNRFISFFEAIVSLPLVLPPSVLGYYLLVTFSPKNSFGSFLEKYFQTSFVFNFQGMVLASVIFGLPFMVQPLKSALANLPISLKETSYSLGKSKTKTLFYVLLPNIKPSILAALILTFTHTLGEFGVILMIGGNIPGKTRVASIAIYDEVQAMNYKVANLYSVSLLIISFLALIIVYRANRKTGQLI
jgi:molybdate transport system permease protein